MAHAPPYERVMARTDVKDDVKAKLRVEHERLNPLILKCEADRWLRWVFDIHKRYGKPNSGVKTSVADY